LKAFPFYELAVSVKYSLAF